MTIDHLNYQHVKTIQHPKSRLKFIGKDYDNGTNIPHKFECMSTSINLYFDHDLFKSSDELIRQNRYLLLGAKKGKYFNIKTLLKIRTV